MSKLALEREDLRACDDDELDTRLINARKELFNLRFQVATGRLDNVARIQQVRREVARILTVQRDREILAAESLEEGPHLHHNLEASALAEHPIGRKEARHLRRKAAAEAAEAEAALHAPADAEAEAEADEEDVVDIDDAEVADHHTAGTAADDDSDSDEDGDGAESDAVSLADGEAEAGADEEGE